MKGGEGNDGTHHHRVCGCSDPLVDRGETMSVYIRGMEMPTSCSECNCCRYYGIGEHMCDITDKEVDYENGLKKRRDDCPLVSAADVSSVVRCKDCKFGVRLVVDLDGHEGIVCCHGNISHMLDWFCAEWAKMEEAE